MGVTIHWQGKLLGEEAYTALIRSVRKFAHERNWPVTEIEGDVKQLLRVIGEQNVDYEGPTFGVVLWPHPECEPVKLEFDEDLFTQEFCKTQFAGPKIHVAVVELLRAVAPYFAVIEVTDEGEFWGSSDEEQLARHFANINARLDELTAADPTAKSPVLLPSGRLLDIANRKKH